MVVGEHHNIDWLRYQVGDGVIQRRILVATKVMTRRRVVVQVDVLHCPYRAWEKRWRLASNSWITGISLSILR